MKKLQLKRLTLDELAEIMPIMEEDEQKECIGAAYVYGGNGVVINSAYQSPDPSSMYVLRADSTYSYGGIEVSVYSSAPIPLSQATEQEKANIVNSMARSLGISSYVSMYNSSNYGNYGQCSGGTISVNSNSYNFQGAGNYNNIMLNLIHEKHHSDTLWDAGTRQSEYQAYSAMQSSYYYSYASSAYRQHIDDMVRLYR